MASLCAGLQRGGGGGRRGGGGGGGGFFVDRASRAPARARGLDVARNRTDDQSPPEYSADTHERAGTILRRVPRPLPRAALAPPCEVSASASAPDSASAADA